MNQDDYYYQLNTKCIVSDQLIEYADQIKIYSVVTFMQKIVPLEIIKQDPVMLYFYNNGWTIKIFKMEPFTFYDWHRDSTVRGCAVNLLLNAKRSTTLFQEDTYYLPRQKRILELSYLPNTYYMFNTAAMHCVTNFESVRYSVSMFPPHNPNFAEEVKDYFKYTKKVKEIDL
jgi:hypothetical protein